MAPPRSIADRCRAHRAEMELAIERGITPRQAREELDRQAARAAWTEGNRRLAAKRAGHPLPPATTEPEDPRQPWWLRD